MTQVVEFPPPTWKTWIQFLAPDFGLSCCGHLGSELMHWRIPFLCQPSFFISLPLK